MKQHRLVLRLKKFERTDEQRNVVPVNRSVITQPELFKDHAGQEEILHAFFEPMRELDGALARDRFDEPARLVVEAGVSRVRDDVIQVTRDRADVFRDRPFIVVQHHDEPPRLRLRIVQRLITDAAGERRIARHDHHILIATSQIASNRHSETG